MTKILKTDNERIEKIVSLLQEEAFDYFLNMRLYNARYNDNHMEIIQNYSSFSQQTFAQFKNEKLKDAKNVFDLALTELVGFMLDHFFLMHDNRTYILYPDQKNSSDSDDQIFWHEKLNELHKLINNVNSSYKKMFLTMKKYMEDKNTDNIQGISIKNSKVHFGQGNIVGNNKIINNSVTKKWWEKSWVQIIFIISAIFTIVTFIVWLFS
jgi:hypothetical protein